MKKIRFNFWGHTLVLEGGPYRNRPAGVQGVKMAAEIDAACRWDIPTQDFTAPDPELIRLALPEVFEEALNGKRVFVGCMGGIGRTGSFLAAFAKMMGEKDPVGYVRQHYSSHAVETQSQQVMIDLLEVKDLYRKCRWMAIKKHLLGIIGCN